MTIRQMSSITEAKKACVSYHLNFQIIGLQLGGLVLSACVYLSLGNLQSRAMRCSACCDKCVDLTPNPMNLYKKKRPGMVTVTPMMNRAEKHGFLTLIGHLA